MFSGIFSLEKAHMHRRFVPFLHVARWTSVLVALMYHVRFLLFVDYEHVEAKTWLSDVFYFLTGLGHESCWGGRGRHGQKTGRARRAPRTPPPPARGRAPPASGGGGLVGGGAAAGVRYLGTIHRP